MKYVTDMPIQSTSQSDLLHLTQALDLAKRYRGFCSPNPSVGAILVQEDGVIIEGYHQGPGTSHAEVKALQNSSIPKNGTMYVTLEPCCHWGRTPPCVDAIIQAGIKRVVFGFLDPNPLVQGKGLIALSNAGIDCEQISIAQIDDFYASYKHWHQTKKPFVTAKIAMSMNGAIAGQQRERTQITGPELHELTHYSRKTTDAILTTIETIIHDNPAMNARYQNEIIAKPVYILDSQLRLPANAAILKTAKSLTIFYDGELTNPIFYPSIRYIPVKKNQQGLDLQEILQTIGQDGVHDLWIEAGGKCFSSFIEEKLVQRAMIYIAPRWIPNGHLAFHNGIFLDDALKIHWQSFGKDVLCDIRW